jgi:acyl-CoA thioester hydrolase
MADPPLDIHLSAMKQHTIDIEVRYYETDGQGIVHHANYFQYFELARVQLLKATGHHYADLERNGYFLVVHKIGCRYLLPAKFGDTLRIVTTVERATAARIDHSYQVFRGEILLAEAQSTLACINRDGQVQRMPSMLFDDGLPAAHEESMQ